ncbi:hypothetical protein J4429_04415 [Candidatus Pacearchaeota archaeon]|nr:hypothetical protein [Candidatus Pacearchaeota archaeon]
MKSHNNSSVLALLGLIIFFLVISVIYSIISISGSFKVEEQFQIFMPLVVFTGFFIFLIGAMLIALAIFKKFNGFRE